MKKTLASVLCLMMCLVLVVPVGASSWTRRDADIVDWDRNVDFLIVGFGLAGAAAAVEAHGIDPEAKILTLEKMPAELAGGNSIASGQTFPTCLRPANWAASFQTSTRTAASCPKLCFPGAPRLRPLWAA